VDVVLIGGNNKSEDVEGCTQRAVSVKRERSGTESQQKKIEEKESKKKGVEDPTSTHAKTNTLLLFSRRVS
jgi:hypothetical protein